MAVDQGAGRSVAVEAVHLAVKALVDAEADVEPWRAVPLRGETPVAENGAEAEAVSVGSEAAEDEAGYVRREVRPVGRGRWMRISSRLWEAEIQGGWGRPVASD